MTKEIDDAMWTPARASWECVRCRAVNAPHVDRCACSPIKLAPVSVPFVPVSPTPLEPTGWPPWLPPTTIHYSVD